MHFYFKENFIFCLKSLKVVVCIFLRVLFKKKTITAIKFNFRLQKYSLKVTSYDALSLNYS